MDPAHHSQPVTRIVIYCQPGARQTRLAGLHAGMPKVQLAAVPSDGAANRALLAFIGVHLGVPRSAVCIESGAGSRIKRLRIDGLDGDAVRSAMGLPTS